ncbi:MAG: MFS transporter [Candidatus Aquilonibacter sp.]|jgi:DHA1 family inner membrane transport protein
MNQPRASLGLYALTLGAFAIGTTEFVPVGLLPEIARDLHVSISAAGFLVTGYALGVAIGAPLFTIALNRVNRKTVLILMLTFFIAGNGLAAVANDYGVLLLARIIAAFNHGTFFGIGAIVAGSLVPKERSASAIATMFLGLTVAMVMGVPFGAFVGQHLGWHAPFALIALIGVLALAGVWLLVPSIESKNPNLTAELRTLASGPVMLSLLTTLLGFGGVFVLFTYISPLLQEVTGFTPHAVAALLVLFGVGTLAGNLAAGRAADRSLGVTLLATVGGLAAVLALSSFMWPSRALAIIATFVIGFFGFATATPLQLLVIRTASKAPNLASSANISAFNIGNALGAALGAVVIAEGFPLQWLGLLAACVSFAGALVAIPALRSLRPVPAYP